MLSGLASRYPYIIWEVFMPVDYNKQGKIAIFTLNRPQVMNALDISTLAEFHSTLIDFRDDPDLWAGIITGAGEEAFCTGIDIRSTLSANDYQDRSQPLPATLMRGLDINKPLIAAINGLALGGGLELVLACDIRIASENASFGTPEVSLGLIPAWGGTQRLPRQIAWCHAAEMLLTGKVISAEEAHRIGLINRVVPKKDLISTAKEWADVLCNSAPLAVRAAKEAMIKGSSLPLDQGLDLEDALETYLKGTEDYFEGIKAFTEKRKPFYRAR
jgi:E-phenylitaconyl-CoA hydratase